MFTCIDTACINMDIDIRQDIDIDMYTYAHVRGK
jgi:hypothetical protein